MATQQDFVVKKGLDLNGNLTFRSNNLQLGSVFNDSSALNLQANSDAVGGLKIGSSGAFPLIGYTQGIERFRADANGNFLIGTATANYNAAGRGLLELNGSTDTLLAFKRAGANKGYLQGVSDDGILLASVAGATGYLAFNTNAFERMRITSAGNIGVGGIPTQKLDVIDSVDVAAQVRTTGTANSAFVSLSSGNGTTSGRYAYVRFLNNDTTGQQWRMGTYGDNNFTLRDHTIGVSRFVVDTAGNMGIGATAPSGYRLSVTDTTNAALRISSTNETAGVGSALLVLGSTTYNRAQLSTVQVGTAGGDLVFSTAPSAGGLVSHMRIMSDGNMGLGVATPNLSGYGASVRVLTVQGNSLPGVLELADNITPAQNNTLGEISFVNNGSGVTSKQSAYITGFQDGSSATAPGGAIKFTTRTDGGNGAERMRIDNSGILYKTVSSTSGAETVALRLWDGTNSLGSIRSYNSGGYNQHLRFYTAAGSSSATESLALTIDHIGYVYVNAAAARLIIQPSVGTNNAFLQFQNGAGNAYVGVDSSSGSLGVSNALTFWHTGNYPIVMGNNNVERLRIDTAGNFISVGTLMRVSNTSATDTVVSASNSVTTSSLGVDATGPYVAAGGTTYALRFFTNSAERMRIDASGNVGIGGAANAAYKLHVQRTGSNQVASQGTTDASFITNVNGTQALYLHSTSAMSEINELRALPLLFTVNGAERARITSAGYVNIGTGANNPNNRAVFVRGVIGISSNGTTEAGKWYSDGTLAYLDSGSTPQVFYTAGAERVRIDASGNVGISNNNPDATLSVDGTIRVGVGSPTTAFKGIILASTLSDTFTTDTDKVMHHYSITAKSFSDVPGAPGVAISGYAGIRLYTNATERIRIDTAGNLGIGVVPSYRVHARQDQNGTTTHALVNATGGTAATTQFLAAADTASLAMEISSSSHATKPSQAWIYNTGPYPVVFGTNSVERMRLDANGNFLYTHASGAMGYGTGSGGTVTQATSKSTSVSLNKPSGQITLNAASLASNATVMFAFNNTLIAATDVVQVTLKSGHATAGTYQVWAESPAAGACTICVRNINASSLSEALVLNFVVIKGASA